MKIYDIINHLKDIANKAGNVDVRILNIIEDKAADDQIAVISTDKRIHYSKVDLHESGGGDGSAT